MGNTFQMTPAALPPASEGYYAKRELVLLNAGTYNFGAQFNLDDGVAPDEAIVQEILTLADDYVDSVAYELGLAVAADPHYIATDDNPLYNALKQWASRWARAQGYLLRGASADDTSGVAGQMTGMKAEAEERIRALLTAKLGTDTLIGGAGEFTNVPVYRKPCLDTEENERVISWFGSN